MHYHHSRRTLLCFTMCFLLTWQQSLRPNMATLNGSSPFVIGHRGACGYRPEHTIPSYELAIEMGANFVEPDLVMTNDGVLICRHGPGLSSSTNVASLPEFADKKTNQSIMGIEYEDWFASDFTLEEIKKLRCVQNMKNRSHAYDDEYQIPTLDELIALVKDKSAKLGRTISIYPEIKDPTYHNDLHLPITDTLLSTLEGEGWIQKDSPVIIQCFEVATLQYVRSQSNIRIAQLITGVDIDKDGNVALAPPFVKPWDFVLSGNPWNFTDLVKDEGLDFIKTYADGILVLNAYIIPYKFQQDDDNDASTSDMRNCFALKPTDLIQRAHNRNLFVHSFTFRDDPTQLLGTYSGNAETQYFAFFKLGVDGVFTDFPNSAVDARNEFF